MRAGPLDIVLVDDAPDVRLVVSIELAHSKRFRVVGEGATGREAVDLARELQPALILLDVSMPDMDGVAALPLILEAAPATRVVMFSGFSSPALQRAALALGAVDFVEKDLPISELADRLLQAVGDATHETTLPAAAASERGDEAQAELAEHLERFRDVFERASLGMATMTLAGTIVRANAALTGLLEREDLVGTLYVQLVGPDGRQEIVEALARLASGAAASAAVEHALVAEPKWVRSTLGSVIDTRGQPLYLFLQVEDLTTRRAAVEALRQSEERFRLMVESVVDYAIFMLDPTGRVSSWNAGAHRIKGYTADEIIGQHFRVFYTEDARASRHPEHELELAAATGRYEEEGWRVRKDGTQFFARVTITALFDATGELIGFGKVTRDITERRLSTEALAEANELLEAAARDRAEFVAVTAHELRSPVAAITGAASLLADRFEEMDGADRTETLKAIASSSGRIRRLLDDLLTTSRLDAGAMDYRFDIVAVRPLVAEAIASLPNGPDVVIDVSEELAVHADGGRVVQILVNLIGNAFAYGAPPVEVTSAETRAGVEIRVRNHGVGVPADVVPNLFTKFFRGSGHATRGTGLGLYIARQMARAHGGDVWYEADDGPTFVVRLPSARPFRLAGD